MAWQVRQSEEDREEAHEATPAEVQAAAAAIEKVTNSFGNCT